LMQEAKTDRYGRTTREEVFQRLTVVSAHRADTQRGAVAQQQIFGKFRGHRLRQYQPDGGTATRIGPIGFIGPVLLLKFWKGFESQQGFDPVGVFDLYGLIMSVGGGLRDDAGGPLDRVSQMTFVTGRNAPEHDFDSWRVSPGLFNADAVQRQILL